MAAFIFIVQVGALWLSATEYIVSQTPDNPESVGYTIYYIAVLLIFTAIMVFMIKKNKMMFIRVFVYFAICSTLFYVFVAVFDKAVGYTYLTLAVSIAGAVVFTVLLYKYPEWYVIDVAGLVISIGACAVLGASLSYMPIIILMVALIIYDFISVYKTKHMLTLANGMMNLKLPILFVIPKKWDYSYIKEDFSDGIGANPSNGDGPIAVEKKPAGKAAGTESETATAAGIEPQTATAGRTEPKTATAGRAEPETATAGRTEPEETTDAESLADSAESGELTGIEKDETEIRKRRSDALFMGLGDAVIPTLLVISANRFLPHDGWIAMPALFTMAGTFLGFAVLMYVVSKGNPQAGLPFLNTGAILGFVADILISGTAISLNLGF